MRRLVGIIALTCLSAFAGAVEDSDVLFFAPFEDSVDAAVAAGAGQATPAGTPRFAAGVRGKAVVLDAQSLLSYAFAGNALPSEGTVMMWFKPMWPADDDQFHHLFYASTGNDRGKALNAILLYKYPKWARLMLYTSDGQLTGPQEGRSLAYRENMAWEPGTWHHVAATWSATLENTELNLYLDGERLASGGGQVFVPDEAPSVFRVGGPAGSGETWFDDLMVFGRPLLAAEIASIYANYAREQVAEPAQLPFVASRELGLKPYVLFGRGQLVVLADYRGARRELGGEPGHVHVAVTRDNLNQEAEASTTAAGTSRLSFELGEIGPGPVTVEATLRDGVGRLLRTGALSWTVPATPAWVGNRLGITDQVPPPWTPVQVASDRVEVWGRSYRFGPSPLPEQVVSGGHELLRAPIILAAGANSLSAQSEPGRCTEQVARHLWRGALGALSVTGQTEIEYDGFMRVDLTLTPAAATTLRSLELRVPLRPEVGTLYHHCNGEWTELSDAGAVGSGQWSKPLPFVPYVWLGNEERGLAWWCESDWNWHNPDPTRALEIAHTPQGTDLIVRFIAGETTLNRPMELTFGFMATPVKPLPAGWRNWNPMFISATNLESFAASDRWLVPGMRNIGVLWNSHVGSFSYLPADPAEMARKVALLREAGWRPLVSYFAMNGTQVGTPDYLLAEEEMRRDPYRESTVETGNYGAVCQASIWADLLIWCMDRTMELTGTDGVYIDCSSPHFCRSSLHGCDHGRYPLLGARELQKRIYNLVHARRGGDGLVYSHVSESVFMTTYSFADVILNGEQYNKKDLATLDRPKFRAEFMPSNTGVPQFLLPTLTKFQQAGQEKMPGAEFLAFPLLHDVICCPAYLGRDTLQLLRQCRSVMHQFGVAQAQFLPYWSNAGEMVLTPPEAAVSAYLGAEGRSLLLIAQGPREPVTLQLELRGRLAQLCGLPARDALSRAALQWRESKLVWPLPGSAVQMAVIEPAH